MDCIFCKIVAGEIPAEKVYEDADTLAFLDITPVNPGHVLVIPKKHYKNILDIPEAEWLRVMQTVHRLAPKIKEAVGADGVNITTNNEPAAHQIVMHSHVHIIPRFAGDPHKPWVGKEYADGEAKKVAEKIKAAI
jgi:histidine triad (HIT) family protein